MITIKINPENPELSERFPEISMTFENSASLGIEVFPSLFKSKYLATGTVVWIDSGRLAKRLQNPLVLRPVMAPVRISNTGFCSHVSSSLESILTRGKMTVVNSVGDRFVVAYKRDDASPSETHVSDEIAVSEASSARIVPVPLAKSCPSAKGLFAHVAGYVPSRVEKTL